MSAVKEALIAKIESLDEQSQLRVLEFVNTLDQPKMSFEERDRLAEKIYQEFRAKYGENVFPSSAELLNEIREERLNDIMGGL